MKIKLQCFVIFLLLQGVMAYAGAIRNLSGFAANVYGPNDDGSYDCTSQDIGVPSGCTPVTVPIGFSVNFYGETFSDLYLNNNGNVTFDAALGEYTPYGLSNTESQIIAPFFADVDTRTGNTVTFGNDIVDGHLAFGVNWIGVGYFSMETDRLNSFQLVLIERSDRNPGDFDIEFNYDQIQWETGDASDGVDGLGGSSAVAGFSNGSGIPGTSFQLVGSLIPGEFIDNNPGGLIHNDLNTNVPGRYVIPIVNLTNTVLNVERFSQGDSRWAGNAYAGSAFTIQEKGCALACLAMALEYEGITTDPGALNTLLTAHNDFVGTSVNWDAATRDASSDTLEFHAYRSSDSQYLSQILSEGYPVIVGVNLNAAGAPTHFVLVIGEERGEFIINDPGHANSTTLDAYDNNFETRGYVGDPVGNIAGLDIAVGNPAEVLVLDPLGRRTGYDPSSGNILQEIPQSVHFLDAIEASDLTGAPGTDAAHQVEIYQPLQGTYQFFLTGTSAANSQLLLRYFIQTGAAASPLNLAGIFASNTITELQALVGPTNLASQPFTNEYPWTVSPSNGPALLAVQFTAPNVDSVGNTVTNWSWNFGDGWSDTQQSPMHIYTSAGTFFPSLTALDSAGGTVASYGPAVIVTPSVNLVLNGDFQTGVFTDWTITNGCYIDDGSSTGIPPYFGNYEAALDAQGTLGYLAQTLTTAPGARYLLSFWLNSPDGLTPNEFLVSWNGGTLLDETNLGAFGWTNIQLVVTATDTNTVLEFGFQDDQSNLILDDVNVVPGPSIASLTLSGTNLVVNGSNGLSGATCYVLMSTNLAQPLRQWAPVATNVLGASGTFSITVTNGVNRSARPRYYILGTQ
jgi:hypothetical protein